VVKPRLVRATAESAYAVKEFSIIMFEVSYVVQSTIILHSHDTALLLSYTPDSSSPLLLCEIGSSETGTTEAEIEADDG